MKTPPVVRLAALLVLLAALLVPAVLPRAQALDALDQTLATQLPQALSVAKQQVRATIQANPNANLYPGWTKTITDGGDWVLRNPNVWTSGYFPGSMWWLYEQSGDSAWRNDAQRWLTAIEGQKTNAKNDDLGFLFFPSYARAYELTGNDAYRQVVLAAARSEATRYNSSVGAFTSWTWDSVVRDHPFNVIIDHTLGHELLFWAAKHGGDASWADKALTHARTVARSHVRADGSTYHIVDFNPATGAITQRWTGQGCAADSTWSRGQAWAIAGFTMTYRETNKQHQDLLATAEKVADWYIANLPNDPTWGSIPLWDFNDATCTVAGVSYPKGLRDSSAAAIAANGLLELSTYVSDSARRDLYLRTAKQHLLDLTRSQYLVNGSAPQLDAVVMHATANIRERANGVATPKYDHGSVFADYYLLEAIGRYNDLLNGNHYPLQVSTQANRSNALNLSGQTVRGTIYVTIPTKGGIKQVNWWLDGRTSTPRSTENLAPYDFAGGTAIAANGWDTRTVADGQHTIIAEVIRNDGTRTETRAAFVVANTTPTTPTPTVTPPPAPTFPLLVSRQANRSNAVELNNQTLSGNAYIFVPAGTNIKQVSFWLDDPNRTSAPRRTESGAPYDFANGTATAANPWDTRTIANGQHAVTAELTRTDGSKAVVTAVFTIAN
jgi:unsaturated chondroitin disaccharide hydrolase